MICDNCRKNEATIHLIQLNNNGEVKKFDLCKECAKELAFLSDENINESEFNNSTNILAIDLGFFNENESFDFFNNLNSVNKENKRCQYCNISLSAIKKIGRVGCPKCYDEFKEELNPLIKLIQTGIEHKGKIPINSNRRLKIEKKIKDLKFMLEEQIIIENFEEAAKLRDKISSLQKKLYYSGRKLKK
ncbi:MAG: UvrB/UvrC motif-containing protein [Actinobacteria bacterium]|nr:UvrB/UvrC motif-containing protein [Cyanobacteriota bacterium]MCL5771751.1 UvrB/UvrC motif-containing protein [Actinomycetota bacterium]